MTYRRIAIDTSKSHFTLHGVDRDEKAILRKDMSRSRFISFFSRLEPTTVYLRACSASHHRGRTLQAMGHQVHLIPPQYVKPFVKRGKNDRNDAQAINDAASRPDMRFTPIKSAERQADLMELIPTPHEADSLDSHLLCFVIRIGEQQEFADGFAGSSSVRLR